jgi:hypothetical protein
MLKSDRNYVRRFAKRELRDQGAVKVTAELDAWAAKLDATKEADAHALLEAAWAREGVNSFSPAIWRKLWENSDYAHPRGGVAHPEPSLEGVSRDHEGAGEGRGG